MKLEDYGTPLAYDAAFWMLGLTEPRYPLAKLGKLSMEVSEKLRALAIITLLVKADSDFFYHNLIRSGRARLTYLERLRQAAIQDDHFQCAGWYEPLLDAIAAGDFELARRIAGLVSPAFRAGHEYEDDHCYAQIVHRLIQEPVPETELEPLMERFEAYLDGQASARLDVINALAEHSQDGFDAAFASLLDERGLQIEADKKRGQLEEAHIVPQRHVFVEGLALLRLAERRGLTTQPEYQYCPSLARVPMVAPFPGE
jgi:hypothetical protein